MASTVMGLVASTLLLSTCAPAARAPLAVPARSVEPPDTAPPVERPDPSAIGRRWQPNRDDVVRGMRRIQPRVSTCFSRYHPPGEVMVDVVVGREGRVVRASVIGPLAGTPTAECILEALRAAEFPPFDGPDLQMEFPLQGHA